MKKTVHILLVEDDEVDIMNVRHAFTKNKILNPLHIATNGVEALELLSTAKKRRTSAWHYFTGS